MTVATLGSPHPRTIDVAEPIESLQLTGDDWCAVIEVCPNPYGVDSVEARVLSFSAHRLWLCWIGTFGSVDEAMMAATTWAWEHRAILPYPPERGH